MRKFLILPLLLILVGCASSSGPNADGRQFPEFSAYDAFKNLSETDAKKLGKTLAESDFKKGIYRILIFGEVLKPSYRDRKLFRTYGVATYSAAGCLIEEATLSGIIEYNLEMSELLNQHFGRDIFKEIYKKSQQGS